jgi:hypothetical protein
MLHTGAMASRSMEEQLEAARREAFESRLEADALRREAAQLREALEREMLLVDDSLRHSEHKRGDAESQLSAMRGRSEAAEERLDRTIAENEMLRQQLGSTLTRLMGGTTHSSRSLPPMLSCAAQGHFTHDLPRRSGPQAWRRRETDLLRSRTTCSRKTRQERQIIYCYKLVWPWRILPSACTEGEL